LVRPACHAAVNSYFPSGNWWPKVRWNESTAIRFWMRRMSKPSMMTAVESSRDQRTARRFEVTLCQKPCLSPDSMAFASWALARSLVLESLGEVITYASTCMPQWHGRLTVTSPVSLSSSAMAGCQAACKIQRKADVMF
jgi:hypothetical protein